MYKSMFELILYPEQYENIYIIENKCKNYESIKKYAIVLHDNDEKKPHYHVALHFGRSFDSDQLKTMFDIQENQINKIQGRWRDVILYLTHRNRPEKHQYNSTDVVSSFNYDDEISKQTRQEYILDIITKYSNIEIGYYELWSSLDNLEKMQYDKKIELAMKVRNTNIKMKGDRDMQVIYVKGPAGSGKTLFSKFYSKEILNKSYYISSSSNDVLQDYMGQKIIILDDLRGDSFKYNDLLKVLDNHTNSSVKSRYFNKAIDCELVIITSVKDVFELYSKEIQVKDDYSQLLRRITEYIEIKKDGSIYSQQLNLDKYRVNGIIEYYERYKMPIRIESILKKYKTVNPPRLSVYEKIKEYTFDTKKK